jgi:predicted NACHT family NTPase
MPDPFQPYLESICATYAQWWQLYTLTDAAGQAQQAQAAAPIFDFGLMVQTVWREGRDRREASPAGREPEKVERLPVLAGVRKYAAPDQASPHVLLVGRPGSGKSTALARLLLEEAAAQKSEFFKKSDFSPRIPVLVELRYWQGSIEQLVHNALTRHGLAAEHREQAVARSLLLFDGMNELPSEEARSQISAFRRDHP